MGRVDLPAPLGQIVSLHLSPDGKLAYAANENMDHVYAVDLASRRIVKNWLLPKGYGQVPPWKSTKPLSRQLLLAPALGGRKTTVLENPGRQLRFEVVFATWILVAISQSRRFNL